MARQAPSREPVVRGDPVGNPPGRSSGLVEHGPEDPVRPSVLRKPATRGRRAVPARRVRRVIRRIDTWTVLKLSFLFYLCICLVLLIAGVVLWNIASAFNVIHNVEKFIKSLFDLQTFKLQPSVIFEASALGGVLLVILGTWVNLLATVLYNLISDVIGGVQVIVLEEEADEP